MRDDPRRPAEQDGATLPFAGRAEPGAPLERIGRYRILREIGAGAEGLVYEAEQEEPVRRRVAVKVLRARLGSREAEARFAVERQALAMMDHPSIATVYDAGTVDGGPPYIVMELVRGGMPLTAYCDERRLGLPDRLRLFVAACEAIHHAHQRGVIHRDLKPTNVLVTEVDSAPVPKIIDFGIAKAVGAPITPRPPVTDRGQVMGTLLYMSPEQLAGSNIDVRTDVYALGIILYELVSGTHPFDLATLPEDAFSVPEYLQDAHPPAPSVRFRGLGEERHAVAARRHVALRRLASRVRGDLDAITMKAMANARGERYGSAIDLARDVERHLHRRPVAARGRGAWYVAGRFVRRNMGGVLATVGISVAVVGGPLVGLVRARQAERAARLEAVAAHQVSQALGSLFRVPETGVGPGGAVTMRDVLDRGMAWAEDRFSDQPRVRGRLLEVLGTAYMDLGLFAPAGEALEQALAVRRQAFGDSHPEVAAGLHALGTLSLRTGRLGDADSLLRVALAIREEALGDSHPLVEPVLRQLARVSRARGAVSEASSLEDRADRIQGATVRSP